MAIPFPLQEALGHSITSGTFIDTEFWVFSKRGSMPGRVGEPKALFVNGHVVRTVPRLGARMFVISSRGGCLSHRFIVLDQKEAKDNLRTRFPADKRPYTCDYDHDIDSDLEEDGDWDPPNIEDPQVVPEKWKSDQSDSGTLVGRQNSDAKGNESPDIISVSDVDSLFSDSVDAKAGVATTPTHIGTVVIMDDIAFVT